MCGKDTDLFLTEIEGTELKVCDRCGKHGRVIRRVAQPKRVKPKAEGKAVAKTEEPEIIESIVDDYGMLIKKKREKLGMTQEELAKRIAERESLIQKIENENVEPSIALARKLERFLKIKLVEEIEDKKIAFVKEKGKGDAFTLGDFVRVRKRK